MRRAHRRATTGGVVIALAAALVLGGCASPGPAREDRIPTRPGAPTEYDALLARAKAEDPTLDWTALRIAYTRTDAYQPYRRSDAQQRLRAAMESGDVAAADAAAGDVLEVCWVDLYAHVARAVACRERGDAACDARHGRSVRRLADSIAKSGDGSAAAPHVVISGDEISAWLFVRGMRALRHEATRCGSDHPCERVATETVREGRPGELFFDVSIPFDSRPR